MHPIPAEFEARIREQFPDDADAFLRALDKTPLSSLRFNAAKPGATFPETIKVPWNEEGIILQNRPRYTLDPRLHAGCYYPQESSSMVLQWVLKQVVTETQDIDALDVCAAPGGKSLILADFLKGRGRVISNEIIRSRSLILSEVLTKWGSSNVIVTNNRPIDFGNSTMAFDVMLVDAPCSGEGMFRKDPESRSQWNAGSAQMCSIRQREILKDVLPALRQNGLLIYSTCTYSKEENEAIIRSLVETGEYELVRWQIPEEWRIHLIEETDFFAMRFLPHHSQGEGFFIAVLRKVAPHTTARNKSKKLFLPLSSSEKSALASMGIPDGNAVIAPNGELYRSPFSLLELNSLAETIYITQPGVHLGKVVRGELIPGHALALATDVPCTAECLPLDELQALSYLRGESIRIQADSGWHRVTFDSCVLGWVKVIGNRINNYYPKEWRVKLKE